MTARRTDRRYTTPGTFWARVEQQDGCWEWQGRRDEKGYGVVGYDGQSQKAHRVAWLLTTSAIPDGLCVLHICDNPGCVRPDHLVLGTQLTNIRDRDHKRRTNAAQPGSAHFAAKLTDDQVRSVRREYDSGRVTQAALAERHGISRGALSKILTRRTYSNVR